MSDEIVSALAATLLSLVVLAALALVCATIVRDGRRKPIPVPDEPFELRPRHVRVRLEHFCSRCDLTVLDPEHEYLQRCCRCGQRWTWSSPIADSVPTPDEPPTMPTGGRAA